jgi:hypothetical protein
MPKEQARVELGRVEGMAAELAREAPARNVERKASFDALIPAAIGLAAPAGESAQSA